MVACSKDSDGEDQLKKFSIGVSVTPTGAGTVSGLAGTISEFKETYKEGSVFSIKANPFSRYAFVEWTGSIQSTNNPVTVTMDSDKAITAVFEPKDTDEDGVTDLLDLCRNTPNGELVDQNGCSDSQRDTDGDGVIDISDTCPNTPFGVTTDEYGCSDS